MTKLKASLFSFRAIGKFAKDFAFATRHLQSIIEKKPIPFDPQSTAQLYQRHMYSKCIALWNILSASEKQDWDRLARPKHMPGIAWFISQCLKPNPGIYLPLQGGKMSGDIDMDGNKIENLPDPAANQDPVTKAYLEAHTSKVIWKDASETALNLANQTAPINWTDLDLTAYTSANANFAIVQLAIHTDSYTDGRCELSVRKNGTTPGIAQGLWANPPAAGSISYGWNVGQYKVGLDAGQVIEYKLDLTGTLQVDIRIDVVAYIE